jgi:hypothetical protein
MNLEGRPYFYGIGMLPDEGFWYAAVIVAVLCYALLEAARGAIGKPPLWYPVYLWWWSRRRV